MMKNFGLWVQLAFSVALTAVTIEMTWGVIAGSPDAGLSVIVGLMPLTAGVLTWFSWQELRHRRRQSRKRREVM